MHALTPMARRCRFNAATTHELGNRTRNGLSASTAPKVQIEISPLWCSNFSNGFAPSPPENAGTTSNQMPTLARAARAKSLFARILITKFISNATIKNSLQTRPSTILPQIHASVEMRDLFFVAVEQERRLLADKESGADHALAFLTPPRMIDVGIHIRVKSVLVRRKLIPEALWLLVHKLDLRQRFRAFESVLPWNNQA